MGPPVALWSRGGSEVLYSDSWVFGGIVNRENRTEVPTLNGLTSLRFLAALLVFGYHGNVLLGDESLRATRVLFGAGSAGVDFFFLLSGFLLAWVYRPNDKTLAFYRRRIARIYPTYLVTLLIGIALVAASDPSRLARGWATPFLLQAWLPDPTNVLAINVPAWSLSAEIFFYALFPFVIRFLLSMGRGFHYSLLALLFVVVVVLSAPQVESLVVEATGYHLSYFPPARLPEFIIGMLVGLQIKQHGFPRIPTWIPALLSLAALVGVGWSDSSWGTAAICLVPFLMLIAAVARHDALGMTSLLHHPWLVRLGIWSYGFYLIHVLTLSIVHTGLKFFGAADIADGWLAWILTLVLATIASGVLHRFIEAPWEKRLKGGAARRSVIADG